MRKLIAMLALLGLSTGFAALTASADTVTYTVEGTFSAAPPFPTTSIAHLGDMFMLTFSVDSGALGPGVDCLPNLCMSPNITPVSFVYMDKTTPSLSLDGTCAPMAPCGTVNFFTPGNGGLFSLMFTENGNTFMFELVAENCFISTSPLECGGFTNGIPPSPSNPEGTPSTLNITGGPFTLDDTMSGLVEAAPDGTLLAADGISGSVLTPSTTVPEPSSLLLVGSGFLALGGFARKRLIARFN
jgi:hypothetical protein